MNHSPDDLIGQALGSYRVESELGRGGMGVVYKARDTTLDRAVALKLLPPFLSADDEARARFIHEAKAASALDHPNIGTVYQVGQADDGRLFIAMAYYAGETLQQKIKRGSLPVDEALDYAHQMALGLGRAHEAGIVHRDVKPANVLVTERGRVKVVDFGIAKVSDVNLTQQGTTLGTVSYMSPEQTRGEGVDAQTDVWALGVVLYELLTGAQPFRGDYEQAVIYSVLNEEPAAVTSVRPEVPEAVSAVVARLLAKDRAERYGTMEAVVADLETLVSEGEPAAVAGSPAVAPPAGRPRWVVPAGVAGVLLMLVLLVLALQRRSPDPAPNAVALASERVVPALSNDLIAVMPFRAGSGPDVVDLEAGMVTMLSVGIDGAGPITTVDHNALLGYLGIDHGPVVDPQEGRTVAAHFGAGRYIIGSVTQLGSRVHLDATLYDAEAQVEERARAEAATREDLDPAVDSLIVQLIGDLVKDPLRDILSVAVRTTDNRDALKAFLRGEDLGRQGYWLDEDAAEQMWEAVGLDSTFALAWARLAYLDQEDVVRTSVRRYGDRLPDRERRLADVLVDDSSGITVTLQQFQAVVDDYPDFAWARFIYADNLIHYGYFVGRPASEARPHLERALQYDPNNSHIIYHLPERVIKDREYDVLDSLLVRYEEELTAMGNHQLIWQVHAAANRGPEEEFERLLHEYAQQGGWGGLGRLALGLLHYSENMPAVERVVALMDSLHDDGPERFRDVNGVRHWLGFWSLGAAGRFRSADHLRLATEEESPVLLLMSVVAVMDPHYPVTEERLRALKGHVAQWDTVEVRMLDWWGREAFAGEYAELKAFLNGLLAYRLEDAAAFGQARAQLRALAEQKGPESRAQAMDHILWALTLSQNGDTEQALALLEEPNPGWSIGDLEHPVRLLIRAELLFRAERYAEAETAYAALADHGMRWVMGFTHMGTSYLRRAEIYEQLGQPERAVEMYTRLIDLWQDADPDVQPHVERAREHIHRLTGGALEPPA